MPSGPKKTEENENKMQVRGKTTVNYRENMANKINPSPLGSAGSILSDITLPVVVRYAAAAAILYDSTLTISSFRPAIRSSSQYWLFITTHFEALMLSLLHRLWGLWFGLLTPFGIVDPF